MIPLPLLAELSLNTAFDIRGEYNDNIDLDRSDKDSDYISSIGPTIELEYISRSGACGNRRNR